MMNFILYSAFIIDGSLLYLAIKYNKYWVVAFALWSCLCWSIWDYREHKYDYVVPIPNQKHITYKVFYGKYQFIVRHPTVSDNKGNEVNVAWSKKSCNEDYDMGDKNWVYALDGNFINTWYTLFHPGICGAVQDYLDGIEANHRMQDWSKK